MIKFFQRFFKPFHKPFHKPSVRLSFRQLFAAAHITFYLFAATAVASEKDATPGLSDSQRYSVPYLTLRNKTGDEAAADFFGGGRDILRAGYCEVSRTQVPALKSIAESVPFYVPEDILQLDVIRELPVEDFWMDVKKKLNGQAPILYTHGFYVSFDRACRRASEFKRSLDLGGRFVLFSWPSDGVIVSYTLDEADVYWSVDPLQKMLSAMVERFGAGKINVVAHSLGTRGVMLALVRMAKSEAAVKHGYGSSAATPLINQIVLLAPDIDAEIFKQYLPHIKSMAKNITVYVSAHDSPLALSKQVHGHARLGEAGSHLEGLDDVEIIDVSDVPLQYASGHLYHLYNDRVVTDLYQLLNKNKAAAERSNLKQTGKSYWRLQPPVAVPVAADQAEGG